MKRASYQPQPTIPHGEIVPRTRYGIGGKHIDLVKDNIIDLSQKLLTLAYKIEDLDEWDSRKKQYVINELKKVETHISDITAEIQK